MKTYTGGCHCGKVRYKFEADEITTAIDCNCSLCSKRGWLLAFVPKTSFELLAGENETTLYQFNQKKIDHLFCKTCGTASYGLGGEMVAINLRCVDDINLDSLTIQHYDGKSL